MKKLLFIVEDEQNIIELYNHALKKEYEVHAFLSGERMLAELEKLSPDLFILDIMLPNLNGEELLKLIRGYGKCAATPVIMVSAKEDEQSKVRLLDMGADDYITKPFGLMELKSRISAVLRRGKRILQVEDVLLDEEQYAVETGGGVYRLTLKEFELFKRLLEQFGKVCLRETLLKEVWDIDFDSESRSLDMHVNSLRDKISSSSLEIKTVRGIGYILRKKGKSV